MKKISLILAIGLFSAISVNAEDKADSLSLTSNVLERYNIDVANGGGVSDLIEVAPIDYTYSDWEEYGEPYNCQYEPEANTIDKGVVFDQELYCVQKQMRYKYTWINGSVAKTETEYQEIDAEHTQEAVGTLTYSTVIEYSAWVNNGSVYSCGVYSPGTDTVNSGVVFTQSRTCKQDQVRDKYTYKVNDVTKESTLTSTVSESQSLSVTQTRQVTGTKVVGGAWVKGSKSSMPQGAITNTYNREQLLGAGATYSSDDLTGQSCTTLGRKHLYVTAVGWFAPMSTWMITGYVLTCQ